MANKMAGKKKNTSQRSTRHQSQVATPRARSDEKAEANVRSDEKEQSKSVPAAAREREERKVQESKPVRRENRSRGPAPWQVRLRTNRYVRFVLDAYYELRHKVTWPSFNEARNMTIAVLLLSAAIGVVLGAADYGLQNLYLLLVHLGGK